MRMDRKLSKLVKMERHSHNLDLVQESLFFILSPYLGEKIESNVGFKITRQIN